MSDDDSDADRTGERATDGPAESDDGREGSFSFVEEAVAERERGPPDSGGSGGTSDSTTSDATGEGTDEPAGEESAHGESADEPASERPDRRDDGEGDAPLADLARDVSHRRAERERDTERESEWFEEVDVGDVDPDTVWDDLVESDDERPPGAVDVAADVTDVEGDAPEYVVPKRAYCQRCRYFTDPPDVACTHDGTEIVELADSDHFRVRGCPMVGDAEFE
jgi:hypothetical protein